MFDLACLHDWKFKGELSFCSLIASRYIEQSEITSNVILMNEDIINQIY